MSIAASIGTAIGEAVGRAYKIVSDISVDSLLDLLNTDNSSGRTQQLSFVDNINQSEKAHFEAQMARRTTPINESCLKYENNLTVNEDGVTSSDTSRRAFMGDYTMYPDMKPEDAKLEESFELFKRTVRTGERFIGTDKKIRTHEDLEFAKAEIDDILGLGTDDIVCLNDTVCSGSVFKEDFGATMIKSRKITNLMRARLIKAIFADDLSHRYAQEGSNDRIDMLKAQIQSVDPGGPLLNEVNISTSDETPIVKELLGTEMLTNQLYIELIFEEEKRVLLESLKLQAALEGEELL